MVQHLVGKKFMPEEALTDHWMGVINEYDVIIKYYYRMSVQIAKNVLNMEIPLKAWDKDVPEILDPLYNRDNIYERSIMNAKIGKEENDDINQWDKNVELTRECIRKPFHMDSIPQAQTL